MRKFTTHILGDDEFSEMLVLAGRFALCQGGEPVKVGDVIEIDGRPAIVTNIEMYLTMPVKPTGTFFFRWQDVCTCHERDDSYACPACYKGAHRVYMDGDEAVIRGED